MRVAAYLLPLLACAATLPCAAAPATDVGSLPIRSGRWSSGDCARPSEASTRFFKPGWTSTMTNACALAARDQGRRIYAAHLTCRADEDDVVLTVASPTALTWINQCMAIEYRFCEQPR